MGTKIAVERRVGSRSAATLRPPIADDCLKLIAAASGRSDGAQLSPSRAVCRRVVQKSASQRSQWVGVCLLHSLARALLPRPDHLG